MRAGRVQRSAPAGRCTQVRAANAVAPGRRARPFSPSARLRFPTGTRSGPRAARGNRHQDGVAMWLWRSPRGFAADAHLAGSLVCCRLRQQGWFQATAGTRREPVLPCEQRPSRLPSTLLAPRSSRQRGPRGCPRAILARPSPRHRSWAGCLRPAGQRFSGRGQVLHSVLVCLPRGGGAWVRMASHRPSVGSSQSSRLPSRTSASGHGRGQDHGDQEPTRPGNLVIALCLSLAPLSPADLFVRFRHGLASSLLLRVWPVGARGVAFRGHLTRQDRECTRVRDNFKFPPLATVPWKVFTILGRAGYIPRYLAGRR